MSSIPLLDMRRPDFGDALLDACRTIGFVSIVGHGIDAREFEAVRSVVAELFALDDTSKRELFITRENYRGFIPLGFFTPNRVDQTGAEPDQYEGYKLHWECPPDHPATAACHLYGPNRWPDALPQLRETVLGYWGRCDEIASRLLEVIADDLGVGRAEMARWHEAPLTNMTLLHYPASERPTQNFHAHKDTNVITLLHPDPVGGLQVRDPEGGWIEVDCPDDALVVNSGEMLELWSGGRMPATPHRVINPSGAERYSFPYFVVPNHTVTVEPLLPPIVGFDRSPMPVGALSAEVWRTNWPDAAPESDAHDLGTLDR